MENKIFILGSLSPRRKEILNYFSLSFNQVAPNFDERSIPFNKDPEDYAKKIAYQKALSLTKKYPNTPIFSADTVVYYENQVFGKPQNQQDCIKMLSALSAKLHSFLTAITILDKGQHFQGVEETYVLFKRLSKEQIELYSNNLNCSDKAGGYFIQEVGSLVVDKIDGCFYNVVGLPIQLTTELLKKVGIDVWHSLSQKK